MTKKGVYFAFRDQGACLSLISIKIYHVVCPSVVSKFALFPETPTGAELTAIVPAQGQCVPNAVVVEPPRLLCKGDGNWTLPSGGCKCMPGYEPIGQSCKGQSSRDSPPIPSNSSTCDSLSARNFQTRGWGRDVCSVSCSLTGSISRVDGMQM